MYEEIFRSPNRPFSATPDVHFYFPHHSIEEARQTAIKSVERAEGPVVILGGAGLGKSLLSDVLAGDLGQQFDIVKLHAARLCSRKALLQNILFELGLPYRDLAEGELRMAILDRLEPGDGRAPDGLCILVDESHTLPTRLLEELRLLTNFTRNNEPRARLVLLGSLQLEETFASPAMESFNQRLAARCYLNPMTREEVSDYVAHQISQAGFEPERIATYEGMDAVYDASEGVPRLANQIMDQALLLAVTNRLFPINGELIEEAWSSLQQLPMPWTAPAIAGVGTGQGRAESTSVEFGELNDDEFETADETTNASDSLPTQTEAQPNNAAEGVEFGPLSDEEPLESAPVATENGFDAIDEQQATGDQELSVEAEVSQNNFFAAFTEPGYGELPEHVVSSLNAVENSDGSEDVAHAEAESTAVNSEQSDGTVDCEESAACWDTEDELSFDASQAIQLVDTYDLDSLVADTESAETVIETETNGQIDAAVTTPMLTSEAFFAGQPTDEKLIALVEEQSQFEAMGYWQNEVPSVPDVRIVRQSDIADEPELEAESNEQQTRPDLEEEAVEAAPAAVTPVSLSPSNLFGDDFDEEFSLEEFAGYPKRESAEIVSDFEEPSHPADELPTFDADLIELSSDVDELSELGVDLTSESLPPFEEVRVELESLSISQSEETDEREDSSHEVNETVQAVLSETASDLSPTQSPQSSQANDGDSNWTVEVNSADVGTEISIHNQVEELLGQLNFQGTQTGFTEEQIESSSPSNQGRNIPEDSIRTGPGDEVYAMHRPQLDNQASELTINDASSYDDDRDLLIVEEDIALPRPESVEKQSVTKQTSYSQLFAKLRK